MTSALSEQSQRLERFLRHKGMDYKEGERKVRKQWMGEMLVHC